MKKLVRNTIITLMIVALSACASNPKIALNPEAKQSIKHIALVQMHEPERYTFNPGLAPGGAALYMFGALGGALLGGIEMQRFNSASAKFTSAVSPLKPNLSNTMLEELESKMREKGYLVTRIPELPKAADGKSFNFSKIDGAYDAILIPTLNGGYGVGANAVGPQMSVSIQLTSRDGSKQFLTDTYAYGIGAQGESQVSADQKYGVQSADAVYENINLAVEGLRSGAVKLADRVVADL